MKTLLLLFAAASFSLNTQAGDTHTLIAPSTNSTSQELTLARGDSPLLTYCSYDATGIGRGPVQVVVTAAGHAFSLSVVLLESGSASTAAYKMNPIQIAGPATLKLKVDGAGGIAPQFATFDVTRAGTASSPTPIPQEAGTNWQVILEASSDLVNWSPVAPGVFPSSTPQRYFRTRLVKQ